VLRLLLLATAAERHSSEGGEPAPDHEAGHTGDDHRLLLVEPKLGAPIGQANDLAAQPLQRVAQLRSVLLDRGADLVGAACRHQLPPSVLVVTVCRIFFASSIAIVGVGAPMRSLRHANRNAASAMNKRAPNTIAKPTQMSPVPPIRIASSAHATVTSAITNANIPNTAPAAIATVPRTMLDTFVVTSAFASSISS